MAVSPKDGRFGMPSPNTVVEQLAFTPARKARPGAAAAAPGPAYQIIRTTQVDAKDAPVAAANVAPLARPAAPVGDTFAGTARKAAKLSISSAAQENSADVSSLIKTFQPFDMKNHVPAIATDTTSGRVAEEERNVKVRGFLYAASREADNDFHLIIGDDPTAASPQMMTMEISALPDPGSASLATLQSVRDSFKGFFGDKLPAQTYDFYQPQIPVEIEGSVFWDASHANGNAPGPPDLKPKMPVIWEVHPITKITFEP